MVTNPKLLKIQGVSKHKSGIDILHDTRTKLFELMQETDDVSSLRFYNDQLDQLEYTLQELWGFPKDSSWHRFWDRPKCTCPKLDNDDRYPSPVYIINPDCKVHGNENT